MPAPLINPVTTWYDMGTDNLRAAHEAYRTGRYRTCVSRAYYAAYCAATEVIRQSVTIFPNGRNNPSHNQVANYILNTTSLPQRRKQVVSDGLVLLRSFREDADYRPGQDISPTDASILLREAALVLYELSR